MNVRTLTLCSALLLGASPAFGAPNELFKLLPSDGSQDDWFGWSVGISGDRAIVGSYLASSAYLYDTTTGAQTFALVPNDVISLDSFGASVAISGNTALGGSPYDDDNGFGSGSVYLFSVATGAEQTKLLPSDGAANSLFGWSLAMTDTIAIIGSPGSEAAYVFDVVNGVELRKLVPNDPGAGDFFGYTVTISGQIALVSAPYDDDLGNDSGSVYVFATTTGQQITKLLASDGAAEDFFGYSIALDGGVAVVGAPRDDDLGADSGACYVIEAFTGQEVVKLLASDGAAGDHFGWSVGMNGASALVGAYLDDDNGIDSGSTYLFDVATGQEITKLVASDGAMDDCFGWSLAMRGSLAIVGAVVDDDNGTGSGSAYLLREVPGAGFCFGNAGCPCGNDDFSGTAGCINSLGFGAVLTGSGSRSVTLDDLVLTTTGCPPNNTGLYFMGGGTFAPVVVGDGLICTGGIWRYFPGTVDAGSVFVQTTPVGSALPGAVVPGATRYFQAWTRDSLCGPPPAPCSSPCGTNSNLSNGYAVTFSP